MLVMFLTLVGLKANDYLDINLCTVCNQYLLNFMYSVCKVGYFSF